MFFSSPPWASVVYWSLDIETGGLDAKRDPIIAVGMLPIRDGVLRLGESYRTLIQPEEGRAIKPESVKAHQLLAGEVRHAPPLREVLVEIEGRIRQGALLVHHHGLVWPKPPVVDTVELLHKLDRKTRFLRPADAPTDPPSTNLTESRRRHGLPDYQAHDALTDAVATAELFLVLRHLLGARTLRDL